MIEYILKTIKPLLGRFCMSYVHLFHAHIVDVACHAMKIKMSSLKVNSLLLIHHIIFHDCFVFLYFWILLRNGAIIQLSIIYKLYCIPWLVFTFLNIYYEVGFYNAASVLIRFGKWNGYWNTCRKLYKSFYTAYIDNKCLHTKLKTIYINIYMYIY